MSYVERRSVIGMLSTITTVIFYYMFYVSPQIPFEMNPSVVDFPLWGKIFIYFFILLILIRILVVIIHLLVEVFIVSRKEKLTRELVQSLFGEDERYQAIDKNASLKIGGTMTAGFLISMIALSVGYSVVWLFYIMYATFAVTGVMIEFLIFYNFRKVE